MADNKIDVIETELIDGTIGESGHINVTLDEFVMATKIKLNRDNKYVISLDARIDSETEITKEFKLLNGSDTKHPITISNKWSRVILQFISNGDDVIISIPKGSYYLDKLKLEEGTVPTTWSQSQNDINTEVNTLVDGREVVYDNKLSATLEGMRSEVSETYYTKSEAYQLDERLSTEIAQTSDNITFEFNKYTEIVDNRSEISENQLTEISKYIRFEDGKIFLGESGNMLELQIWNDKIVFVQDEEPIAYFSNNSLHFEKGSIEIRYVEGGNAALQLGNFAFFPRASGNLSFRKIGG